MRLDGKALAETILTHLRTRVAALKQHGVTPTLAVIQVGDDPGSTAYIRQKQKAAETIGARIILSHQLSAVSCQQLKTIIEEYNNDQSVHGIILQRPLPASIADHTKALCSLIDPTKDVDGFLPNSPYPVPVAKAVLKILTQQVQLTGPGPVKKQGQAPSIVVLGRGETAGKPITEALTKLGCHITVVHSQTDNPDTITKSADIIVSCVGKPNVVRRDNTKKDAILISVGITRGTDGKLHGDYEEAQIMDLASLYTPTPEGVGPVNVACLMENLVQAATNVL